MTTQNLIKLAKKANVILEHADSVFSFLNTRGTFIYTVFYVTEVCGGNKRRFEVGQTRTRLIDVLKREEIDDDYYTNGTEWVSDIKAKNIQ